ncbi:hypothetical protein UFOVP228_53 [uncultured Caudovirales phage]|uniref:Uncharacterized protein n=1 Tax=uncultured Caudovirales phage TaxID=2100421 RepID=A0A6J7WMK2_9CAUD|nr:hypothetical protein UFOVP47_49 [uncultured Caudovirales phage]CAB5219311.1 hypothetical protein UFOVP228_53 [uncultured Caudovirales phage]
MKGRMDRGFQEIGVALTTIRPFPNNTPHKSWEKSNNTNVHIEGYSLAYTLSYMYR